MKSLFELRKEAQALGIEDYASMSKETLAQVIEKAKAGEAGSTVADIDPEEELTEEEKAAVAAAEEEAEAEKKMTPVEKLAARNAKLAAAKAEKEERQKNKGATAAAKKAEAARVKEDARLAKLAEKEEAKRLKAEAKAAKNAATKTEKPVREKIGAGAVVGVLDLSPKGEKPEFRPGMSGLIYDELLKNDGRTFGVVAREIGSHYNMVRRIAEMYFNVSYANKSAESAESAMTETKDVKEDAANEETSTEGIDAPVEEGVNTSEGGDMQENDSEEAAQ